MRGKIILIEGTDCSGKQTQTELMVEKMKEEGVKVVCLSFPMYNTPTGKIIGGPYLGKDYISDTWFSEGPTEVNPKVASLYYAADRAYNIHIINEYLDQGINVVLDRYTPSNMAHQGGKILDKDERLKLYDWIDKLEYGLLELPRPDISILLYLPHQVSKQLRDKRTEHLDGHELSESHLEQAEIAYKELANIYNYRIIECNHGNEIRTIKDINYELMGIVMPFIKEEVSIKNM